MDARTAFAWILVASLAAVTWLLVAPFLSWLLATALLAFVLTPVHRRLADRLGQRLSAGVLAVFVVVVVVVSLGVVAAAALTRGAALLEALAEGPGLQHLEQAVRQYTGLTLPIQSSVQQTVDALRGHARSRVSAIAGAGLHAFLGFLLLVFVLYYLLVDGDKLVRWLAAVTPLAPDVRDELLGAVNDMTWAVLQGHVLVALVQGLVAGVSLVLTGVPGAFILTGAMMLLAIVPVVGVAPVLGGAVVYLVTAGRVLPAAFVVVWGVTAVAITDDYLRALVIDRQSEMHPAVIFVGILGGTYLLGAVGLFVGPIVVGAFGVTVEVIGDHYGVHDRQ